jgi:hypothetical protein
MSEHQIVKPTVFISHASTDADFANALKQEIDKVFANGVIVFCTSSPGAISAGTDWLGQIEQTLESAKAVIAIVTPVSIDRPWLWFEVGATWSRGKQRDCKIYPVCASEIDLGALPSPLDRLQALSMGKAADLKLLFQALIDQFGFGKLSSFRATNITSRIPKYKDVKVKEIDLNGYALYSGKYTGYNDDELIEVIDTELVAPDEEKFQNSHMLYLGREDLIHNGQLQHYRQIDRRLDLPPGTAKRLLKDVAARYNLAPDYENANVVRFRSRRPRF